MLIGKKISKLQKLFMKNLTEYKVILWDFDGVIMDSMPIRDKGFTEVLKSFPSHEVDELVAYHQENGGLSRYVKFRYFFEKIRSEEITEEKILELSAQFSKIMLSLLIDSNLLIEDSCNFIKNNYSNYEMHIVSGSDGKELRLICDTLGLSPFFKSINGSPTPKNDLVRQVLADSNYDRQRTVLIGDSKNDYDAALINGIDFIGYNNTSLKDLSKSYITSFLLKEKI